MNDIKDLVQYENENSRLDFKAVQYTRDKYEEFVKDILSMANADIEGDRYIVIGVKHKPSGEREFLGIIREEFIDQANYQQLIRENIEPDISLEYFPFDYEGNLLGIFCISNCDDKPYMMKKDYNRLKKGDCFIRKGSHQPPMIRADFDKIIEKKISANSFSGEVKVVFNDNKLTQIDLCSVGDLSLPSYRAAKEISEVIEKKRNSPYGDLLSLSKTLGTGSLFSTIPYENRSMEVLEKNLETVTDTKCYFLF